MIHSEIFREWPFARWLATFRLSRRVPMQQEIGSCYSWSTPINFFHGFESPLHPSNQRKWWQGKLESFHFPICSLVINMLFFVALHMFLGYLTVSISLKGLWQQRNSNVTVAT